MSLPVSKRSSFEPVVHTATFLNYKKEIFCVDRFRARSMDQAEAFACRRAPAGTNAISLDGPESSRFILEKKKFCRGASDCASTVLRAGVPGR